MTSTLIDSNVLFDLLDSTTVWADWAEKQIEELGRIGDFVLSPIVFSEVSIPFKNAEQFDAAFPVSWARREDLPWDAAFLAGKAHLQYRQRGGPLRQILPDFLIGAHAAVYNHRVLTRDARRFRTYFPELEIIAPDTHP